MLCKSLCPEQSNWTLHSYFRVENSTDGFKSNWKILKLAKVIACYPSCCPAHAALWDYFRRAKLYFPFQFWISTWKHVLSLPPWFSPHLFAQRAISDSNKGKVILVRQRYSKKNERSWNATENRYLKKKKKFFWEEGRLVVHTSTWGFQDLRSGRFASNDCPRVLWISERVFVPLHDDLWFGLLPLLNYCFQLCIDNSHRWLPAMSEVTSLDF